MSTIVEQLADYVARLRYEDLPPEVVREAKRLIADTVGCVLGGYAGEPHARSGAVPVDSQDRGWRGHPGGGRVPSGHWKNPMSDAELEAKFRRLARAVLPAAATDRLLEELWRLESVRDAASLVGLTVPGITAGG